MGACDMFITLATFLIAAHAHTHSRAVAPYNPPATVQSGQVLLSQLDAIYNTSYYTSKTSAAYTVRQEYGGYVITTPTETIRHYGYTYGAHLRRTVMDMTRDGTTGRRVLEYVPDTSGATPNTAIRRDFAPAIHRYKLHVTDGGTTLAKSFNTSGGFQQFAHTSVGATP